MIIAIGSDHRGFAQKEFIAAALREQGVEVRDCGCASADSADYPDAALAVAELVARGKAQGGVLICGSGIGMSIAANKVKGVRASLCFTADQARTTRCHNNSNVLCLSADALDPAGAWSLTEAWLETDFEGGRHADRVAIITDYEANHLTLE
ncbi:MAG: ribose 5-phosphate isomerase B [Candidatus Krumholzibacteriia bacterium]|jgi:ribose 5-phosphate isomerase B